jgi:hypothetical protein
MDLYLAEIEELDEELRRSPGDSDHSAEKIIQKDIFLKILKANALLMIYNLVESTVTNGIGEIYDKLKSKRITYSTVRDEIKKIWFAYKFRQVFQLDAHFLSYKNKALEIINSIIGGESIELNKNFMSFGGNLDADKIRKVCIDHGITFKVDNNCKAGVRLNDVKIKRNALSHGTMSFSECGRDYSVSEITKIKDQTDIYLRCLIDGMEKYYDEEGYLLSNF